MDIAAMSTSISTAKVQQSLSFSLAKKTMDNAEDQALALIEGMMEPNNAPSQYGFDTYA